MIREIFLKLKTLHQESNKVSRDFTSINTRRVFYSSIIAIVLHIIAILSYIFNDSVNNEWMKSIIFINSVMLCVWLITFFISKALRKRPESSAIDYFIQYFITCIILIYGITITVADQLVSNTITPFSVICFIVSIVLLMRPLYISIIYIASYIVFFFAIGLTNLNQSVLFANRLDGLTSMGLALFVSVLMWRYNIINYNQKQRIQTQQVQLESANKELEKMAYLDPLTGLSNRRYFDEIVNKEIAMIGRKGHESCLIMLDIDFFKQTNDLYGHPVGDSILVQVANLLSKNLRKSDSICRLGGEEFIILLPQTMLESSKNVAEKLRKRIESTVFYAYEKEVRITASFGVAALTCNDETSFLHNYTKADYALYLAKQSGRNCVKSS